MIPDEEPAAARPGLLLLHVPPDGMSVNKMVAPTQTEAGPLMAVGNGLMVTDAVVGHPPEV